MKKLSLALLLLCGHTASVSGQARYWQQQVDYTIDVSLNDKENTLDGFERIEYTNNAPDTLQFIWFHCWPNAYKNDKTAFTDQELENGSTKFYFSDKEQRGYINRLDFKVNDITAGLEDHPQYIDIVKVILPSALAPGHRIIITTPFHVKLPYNFSRGGHEGQSYQATQWYPKPAVYDSRGWHPMPYLDQGEFYSEFGSFDVRISVPKNYIVAATGELQNEEEKKELKEKALVYDKGLKVFSKREKQPIGKNTRPITTVPPSSNEFKTLEYKQAHVHDFAWFANKSFIVNYDSCRLASGKIVDVFTYYTNDHGEQWQQSIKYCKDAVRHYSEWVGEYPYNIVQAVQGPESFGGGMEYPTITIISPGETAKNLDVTIAHEIGHNWFYGILGSNEREHPWMDEGINSYYDAKYKFAKYGQQPQLERIAFETKAVTKTDQPIELSSEKYSELNYNLVAYYKTAAWMRYLESSLGTEAFNKAMHEYFLRWQFKHPQPADFKKVIEESSGQHIDSIFTYLGQTGLLPGQQRARTKTAFIPNIRSLADYAKYPSKNLVSFGPVIGVNSYDKLMAGLMVTNIKLPPSRLQFLMAPLYATGPGSFKGFGFLYYSFYPSGLFRKIDLGLSGAAFTDDQYIDSAGKKISLGFRKLVPGVKLVFREKDPRSNFYRFLRFKSFLIGEDGLRFYRDTTVTGAGTIILNKYAKTKENRILNQLDLVIENNRALYPYRGEWRIEQGKDFFRAGFTGNYFFNYVKGGGLAIRLFAGKFFYSSDKTITRQFATDRYHLNLTGANGYEDYTYSDYFIGRNKFEGAASQQIMIRDGAFKVRTDLLADKVGKTDDWLAAVNLTTTIPAAINPLMALPIKIPLKIFVDAGTQAEAWKGESELDHFLFDAGIYIPLLKETVNIYIPLVYSSVFGDYIKSTIAKKERFWKKISFSIDISNFSFRKIDRNLVF